MQSNFRFLQLSYSTRFRCDDIWVWASFFFVSMFFLVSNTFRILPTTTTTTILPYYVRSQTKLYNVTLKRLNNIRNPGFCHGQFWISSLMILESVSKRITYEGSLRHLWDGCWQTCGDTILHMNFTWILSSINLNPPSSGSLNEDYLVHTGSIKNRIDWYDVTWVVQHLTFLVFSVILYNQKGCIEWHQDCKCITMCGLIKWFSKAGWIGGLS